MAPSIFLLFFSVRVGFSEAAKPRLRSSRTAAVRLGIRCRNLKSSMALSSSSGMATCRRAIRSGLDVICRIGLPTSQESIREVRKAHHPSNLSRLMSVLGHKPTCAVHYLECAPGAGQVEVIALTGCAGLSKDESHGQTTTFAQH